MGERGPQIVRTTTPRWILHVDLDQFLASVELRRHPELVGLPVIVGGTGDPTEPREVVTCASYEARAFGVHAGMPLRTAARQCPDATFLPSDPAAYDEASEQVMGLLRDLGHPLEVWGWDEAYLGAAVADPFELAERIRRWSPRRRACRVRWGSATTSSAPRWRPALGKRVGVFELTDENWMTVMGDLPVDALWGVGPKTTKRLVTPGDHNRRRPGATDAETLTAAFGPRTGLWILLLAKGGGDETVSAEPWVPRSRSHVVTFPQDLTDRAEMDAAISELAQRALNEVVEAGPHRHPGRGHGADQQLLHPHQDSQAPRRQIPTSRDRRGRAGRLRSVRARPAGATARGAARTADAGLTHPGYYRSRLERPRENYVDLAHRHAIGPPGNTFERVQRADVRRGVDQEPVSDDAGQDLVRGLLRGHRVAAEAAHPAAHLWVVAVDPGDLNGVDQWGPYRPRHHHRHPDAVVGQVEAQHLGEPAQTELLALYAACQGKPINPAAEDTFTR